MIRWLVFGLLGLVMLLSDPPISSAGLNNIIFVDRMRYSESDIGAEINEAYAAAKDGTLIDVPARADGTCYQTSTPITLNTPNKRVLLFGRGAPCIQYTPTTATANVAVDWTPTSGGGYASGFGIRGITFQNGSTPCTTNGGCGSSAIGLLIGNTNGGAHSAEFADLRFTGFGTAISVVDANSASWGMVFRNVNLAWNTTGYSQAKSEEGISFVDCKVSVNGTGLNFANATSSGDVTFVGGSIDSNITAGVQTNSSTIQISFYGTHWENLNISRDTNYILGGSATIGIFGGEALNDNDSGPSADWFVGNNFLVEGLTLFSGGATLSGHVFFVNGVGDISLFDKSPIPIPAASVAFAGAGVNIRVVMPGSAPFTQFPAVGGTFITVSALPAAAANKGQIRFVSDSTAIASEGQTCVGSSSNAALAFSNGSVWKCF